MSRWHRTEFDFYPDDAFRARPDGRLATLEGGGGGGGSRAQEMTAMMQAQMSMEQLQWAKQIYAEEAPQREEAARLGNEVSQAQLEQMRQQTQIASQAQEDYNTIYRPIEQRLAADATNYDTPERRAAESAAAVASVEKNLAQQRGATTREMERSGVDPSSGKMADMSASLDLNAAKLKAGAGNAASKAVETVGYARRMDAASLGRGIASSQGTNAALASQFGSTAMGTQGQILAANQTGQAGLQQAYQTGISGLGGAGAQYGQVSGQASAANASKNANMAAGVGAVATIAVVI